MKILQINTVCGYGSTGQICTDLASMLEKDGHESFIAYGQGKTNYKNSYKIGSLLENYAHNFLSRLLGKQGYYTRLGTKKLINFIKGVKPDLIHLHNLHGNYLNFKIFFEFLVKFDIPIVWTLHDCWAFTGKCTHYSDIGCFKWETHCGSCPQVKKYPPSLFIDRSKLMFDDKKYLFNLIKRMAVITVSDWLANEVRKSFLNRYNIYPIYNWIDHKVFKPSLNDIRKEYAITKDKFIILGVSAGWNNDEKLSDFIKLSKLISKDMVILLVGKKASKIKLPANIIHIPFVSEQKDLAEIYSAADVYFHTSVEDTFGKVIAEAMSCGTPTIVYNVTACPELIGEGCGYVVEKRDISAVYSFIQRIKADGKIKYSSACQNYVRSNFDLSYNTGRILHLYKKILDQ